MLATLEPVVTDPDVIARFQDFRSSEIGADAVLGMIRGAVAEAPADHPVPPTLHVAGQTTGLLGPSPAARVLERYLDRLHDRLAMITDALEHADTDAVDSLLHEVARASRQHGCRSVCAAAEDARQTAGERSSEARMRLRQAVAEMGRLAEDVAEAARSRTLPGDARPRA
ncbi:MAG: hypothetical protein AAGI54_09165 [Planctomycetota bacterium]